MGIESCRNGKSFGAFSRSLFFFFYKYNATLNQEDHAPQKLNAGLDNVYVAYLMYPNTAHADRIPSAEGERCISEQSQQPQHV